MNAASFSGLFSMFMSIFNLGASYLLFRKGKVDANILYLLIGITLTFISLTAPIQLHGNYITLFWASEAVLLYWLYQKSSIKIIRLSSLIIWLCMLFSLIIDIVKVYGLSVQPLAVIFNKGFLTLVYCSIASYLLFILRSKDAINKGGFFPGKTAFRIAALILLYTAGFFEIIYQFGQHYPQLQLAGLYLVFYTLLFILLIILITPLRPSVRLSEKMTSVLLAAGIILYLLQVGYSFHIQKELLEHTASNGHLVFHWLAAIVTAIIFYKLIQLYRNEWRLKTEWITWVICAAIIIFLSAETHLAANALFNSGVASLPKIQLVFIKAGWPILWGLSSFCFMWLGMRYKFRMLRIISLTLFTITLVKLFTYDIVNIPAGGKIAAFFSLGVLLLVVSFMYQRLKKIIIDEETTVQ
jgi:hypothetical protein